MTREEMLDQVRRLEPWFHCIELGEDVRTKSASVAGEPADHPSGTWQTIRQCLPEDLTGKDVLDVGCNAGFYAVEAKRRGARRVLGVDARRFHVRQAMFVRSALDLDIEFERMSVYELNPHDVGRFDVTLALGLLYHCKHPMLALEKLARVTKETLIVETATLPSNLLPVALQRSIGGLDVTLYPAAYIENEREAKEEAYNWFLPSVEGLTSMLKTVGFRDVVPFDVREERAVLICSKEAEYADSRCLDDLASRLELVEGTETCHPGENVRFLIEAENTGYARWLSEGEHESGKGAVRLAAHVLKEDGEDLFWYHAGVMLPRDVAPDETVPLEINFRAPGAPGKYIVEFDMVSEHLTWFEDAGSKTLRRELWVET